MAITAPVLGGQWTDSMAPIASLPSGGSAPSLTPITTNISGMSYALNDLFHGAIQFPHSILPNSEVRLHLHFTFPSQPTAGRVMRFEVYHAIGDINAEFSAEVGPQTFDYTVQATDNKWHRVMALSTASVGSSPQSNAIIFRVKRVTNGGTNIDVNPILLFCDAHFQQGPLGTIGEFA